MTQNRLFLSHSSVRLDFRDGNDNGKGTERRKHVTNFDLHDNCCPSLYSSVSPGAIRPDYRHPRETVLPALLPLSISLDATYWSAHILEACLSRQRGYRRSPTVPTLCTFRTVADYSYAPFRRSHYTIRLAHVNEPRLRHFSDDLYCPPSRNGDIPALCFGGRTPAPPLGKKLRGIERRVEISFLFENPWLPAIPGKTLRVPHQQAKD